MSNLLTFPPGWNLNIPAGTMLIRVDVVMNSRPGAGGYCAIIEASDLTETVLIRGGEPETDTVRIMKVLAVRLAEEIQGNRAVIITRNSLVKETLAEVFKPYRMIRYLANSPVAVADATRHAAVMAERVQQRTMLPAGHELYMKPHDERHLVAHHVENSEDFHESQDTQHVHSALQHLVSEVGFDSLKSKRVLEASQAVIDASERERQTQQIVALQSLTANDIAKPTQQKEFKS
jgi:hypothetical protein